jgi:hypothetical protein
VIHHELGRVVAMIEVVSPGNKNSKHAVASFIAKVVDFIRNGIHFLMIDLFPPGTRDPQGIAQAIWDELVGESLGTRPAEKPLTVAAYDAGNELTAYVDALAVGELLSDAPLFLAPGWYVNVPLEQTYVASWDVAPKPIRDLVAPPSLAAQLSATGAVYTALQGSRNAAARSYNTGSSPRSTTRAMWMNRLVALRRHPRLNASP